VCAGIGIHSASPKVSDRPHVACNGSLAGCLPDGSIGSQVFCLTEPRDGPVEFLTESNTQDDIQLAIVNQHLVVVEQVRHKVGDRLHPVANQVELNSLKKGNERKGANRKSKASG